MRKRARSTQAPLSRLNHSAWNKRNRPRPRCQLVYHDQVMIDKDGWGVFVLMPEG